METLVHKTSRKVLESYQLPKECLDILKNVYVYVPLVILQYGKKNFGAYNFCGLVYSSLEKAQQGAKNNITGESFGIVFSKHLLDSRYPIDTVWILHDDGMPFLVTNNEELFEENKKLMKIESVSVYYSVNNEKYIVDDESQLCF